MPSLRPTELKDIIGQENVKQCLDVLIKAHGNDTLPHMIWTGPPGTGKTTFARALASTCGRPILMANGGTIRSGKDILPYLVRIKPGSFFFIDEIHRMDVRVQESMFTVMEDYRYDVAKGAKSMEVEEFTMIGATTDAGMLLQPFYDRFKHHFQLQSYSLAELELLVKINAKKLQVKITDEAAGGLAKRSRCTPRIANSLLEWARDYACSVNRGDVDKTIVDLSMKLRGIDQHGLDHNDWQYIKVLQKAGRPLGINTLASSTNIARCTIENRIEPHLLRMGVVEKTPKGRKLCRTN